MTLPTDQLMITFEAYSNNYQPNIITESRQEFTEMEKKIVVLAVNQLRQVAQSWQAGQNVTLLIPYAELTDSHHSKISAAAGTLNKKRIIHQNFAKPNKHEFDFQVPFPRIRSTKIGSKRYLELVMLSEVVPSFVELGKRYTSYSLKLMLSLSSIYAQRMYEIIMMFYGRGQSEFTYEVSKLRTALNYPPDHDYYDFKRKALTTARNELTRKTGLHFKFTTSRKNGNAVVELWFRVRSDQELINEDVEADLLTARGMQPHEIAAVACSLIHSYKFTRKQQNQILEDGLLMTTFIRVHTEFHHGKRVAKNPTAYIAQALGFGKPASKKETTGKATTGRRREPASVKKLVTDASDRLKPQ